MCVFFFCHLRVSLKHFPLSTLFSFPYIIRLPLNFIVLCLFGSYQTLKISDNLIRFEVNFLACRCFIWSSAMQLWKINLFSQFSWNSTYFCNSLCSGKKISLSPSKWSKPANNKQHQRSSLMRNTWGITISLTQTKISLML